MSTFTSTQMRHPRGVRTGGQFAPSRHGEPDPANVGDEAVQVDADRIAAADRTADDRMWEELRAAQSMLDDAVTAHDREVLHRMLTERCPGAVTVITQPNENGDPVPVAYVTGDGQRVDIDPDWELSDRISNLAVDGGLGNTYTEDKHGTGQLQVPSPTAAGDPRLAFAQHVERARDAFVAADGANMAAKVRARHPEAEAILVTTTVDDYDEVIVDSIRMRDGQEIPEFESDAGGIIRRAFHEHATGRAWAVWARDGVHDTTPWLDDRPNAFIYLDDLLPEPGQK